MIPQDYLWENYSSNKRKFYDLSVSEQARFSHYFPQISLFRLWSAALDAGNEEVFRQLEDIIFSKDEIGKVTREIIKALLNSEKKEAWQLVEKLLLAAQRQEGLRQTVLEALDETSIGGLKYMINVIISNKLARFSSVVRAIDRASALCNWYTDHVIRRVTRTVGFETPVLSHTLLTPNEQAPAYRWGLLVSISIAQQ